MPLLRGSPLGAFLALVLLFGLLGSPTLAGAQEKDSLPESEDPDGGGIVPLGPTPPFAVWVTPKGGTVTRGANTSGHSQNFTVRNDGTNADWYSLACLSTGPVTCGTVSPSFVSLNPGASASVQVGYSVGSAGTGLLRLRAYSDAPVSDTGYVNVNVLAAPTVTLVAPVLTTGSRAVVRTRQPIIRALFSTSGTLDTAATVLRWRGTTVTGLARHSRALLEWEVDSTNWLGIGDSAQVQVTACNTIGNCTTVSRWVVLENDQRPVLGFTGMPSGALGAGFSAPFGPGFSVHKAEVETGFSIPSYVSRGVARSAGLVYSTRQSYPRALVHVDLEVPWPTAGTPDQVKLVLLDGTLRLDSLVLTNPTCATGALKRCRATLQGDFASSGFVTPTRKWLTVEASVTDGGTTKIGSDSVEVVLVDRRSTRYGSGWWPAGVLQLVQAGSDRIVIDPAGNATIYRGNGTSGFLPPPGNFTALMSMGTTWELRPRGSLAKVVFDGNGRHIANVDQNGNRDSIAYSGGTDQVTKFIDPLGWSVTLSYNASGKLTTFTDPGGRQSKVTINGTTNQLTYDSLSSPTTKAATARYAYREYPGTHTVVLRRRIGVIADTTLVIYDSTFRRRPKEVRLPRVPDETGALVEPVIKYTAAERRGFGGFVSLDSIYVELRDPRNHWTRAQVNRWGQALRTWDALGLLGRASYDPDGLLLWSEGKSGDSSRVYHAYDAARRLVKTYIVRGGGNVLRTDSLVYDVNHRLVKRIDSRDKVDSLTYDSKGNVIATRDKAGNVARTVYRTDGLVDSAHAAGETKYRKFSYDATWKNVSEVRDESGQLAARSFFDEYGRDTTTERKVRVQRTSTTSQWQWRRVRTYYSLLNQVDSTDLRRSDDCPDPCATPPSSINKPGNVRRTRRHFDRAFRDSLRVNPGGTAALTLYDRLGRVVSQRPWTDSMVVKDSMVYDVAGNLVKTITRRGHTITTNYDSRNRDTLTVIPGVGTLRKAFGGPLDQLTRMWYDAPVDSIGTVNGELRWGYDTRGRLRADTSYTRSSVRQTTYTYDTHERPSTTTDGLGTWTVRYEANRGIPEKLLTPFADSLVWGTDARGRPMSTGVHSTGPGQWVTQGWSSTNELNVRDHVVSAGTWYYGGRYERQQVDPDTVGPALGPAWIEQHGPGTPAITLRDSLRYDGWERLVAWVATKDGAVVAQDSFSFTQTGNVRTPGGGQVYDATTDRLTQAVIGGVTRTYGYDRAGNLVQVKEGTTVVFEYGYDPLNRLVSVRRLGVLIARYGYDAVGRRIAKRVYSSASGGTVGYTRFVYHGGHVAFETDSAGSIGLRYTWDRGTDRLIGVRDAAGTQYYAVSDKLGSVRGLVKRDGSWQMSHRFGPYGAVVSRDSVSGFTLKLRYGWTGREYDTETGWYFHRARYYSPELRRFVQEDPIGDNGGVNHYGYVGGRVMQAVDPDGLVSVDVEGRRTAAAGFGRIPLGGGASGWGGFLQGGPPPIIIPVYANGEFVGTTYDESGIGVRYRRISGPNSVTISHNGATETIDFDASGRALTTTCEPCSSIPDGAAWFAGAVVDGFKGRFGGTVAAGLFVDSHGSGMYVRSGVGGGLDISASGEAGYSNRFAGFSVEAAVSIGTWGWSVAIGPDGGITRGGARGRSATPVSAHIALTWTTLTYTSYWD